MIAPLGQEMSRRWWPQARVAFTEYSDRWRLSREVGWAVETRKRVESNLRCHLHPAFGNRPIRSVTLTSVLEWLSLRLADDTPKSSLTLLRHRRPGPGRRGDPHRARSAVPADRSRAGRLTSGDPVRRTVPLLFTTTWGNPFTDRTWSREWVSWRDTAGWPKQHGTFHALRHFFATTLITNHAEPQEVQRLLRHKTLRITLETHVHRWPKRERRRGVVGAILQDAAKGQDQC